MPLGWHISVFRQQTDGAAPAPFGAPQGERLAVWQTHVWGLEWLDELVKQQKAVHLGGNGYPYEYTATAAHIVPRLREGPPEASKVWTCDEGDIILEGWEGRTTMFPAIMNDCRPDEWLIIEVWDRS
jgi:hypothetical protein